MLRLLKPLKLIGSAIEWLMSYPFVFILLHTQEFSAQVRAVRERSIAVGSLRKGELSDYAIGRICFAGRWDCTISNASLILRTSRSHQEEWEAMLAVVSKSQSRPGSYELVSQALVGEKTCAIDLRHFRRLLPLHEGFINALRDELNKLEIPLVIRVLPATAATMVVGVGGMISKTDNESGQIVLEITSKQLANSKAGEPMLAEYINLGLNRESVLIDKFHSKTLMELNLLAHNLNLRSMATIIPLVDPQSVPICAHLILDAVDYKFWRHHGTPSLLERRRTALTPISRQGQ